MNYYILIAVFMFSLPLRAQEAFTFLYSIEGQADIIAADVLGNIYTVDGTEIKKYDEKGAPCCSFSDRNYGSVSSIDTRDPLRILVFYKPFGIVRFLDNKLASQSTVNLFQLKLSDPTVVCSSEMQGMWVYDNATYRLYKYNEQMQPVSLSNDLRQDLMQNISPDLMVESDYWLVLVEKKSLYVFDKMGNYFKPIPISAGATGQLIQDEWIYAENDKLVKVNLRTGTTSELPLPFSGTDGRVMITPMRLLHYSGNKLNVYSY